MKSGRTRHALVTGAGRGIGCATAYALAANGTSVTLVSRTRSDLENLARRLRNFEATVWTIVADVRDWNAAEIAITEANAQQPLDILVNSASVNRPGPVAEVQVADLDLILDTNIRGTLAMCRAFGTVVVPAGRGGCVVNVSSQMGSVGYPGRATYCASKHAVNGLTKALALEQAPSGVRVNAVAPTFVHTSFTDSMFEDAAFREEVLGRIPLGRIADVDDVVAAIAFLVSDGARMVTGHVLTVDGGWTAQ